MTRMGFTSTIGIKHPETVADRYNKTKYSFDGVDAEPVEELVALQPLSSVEGTNDTTRQLATTENFRLITQPGVDLPLSSIDRVTHAGRDLEVVGEVARWPHPMIPNGVHHLEATLKYVKG